MAEKTLQDVIAGVLAKHLNPAREHAALEADWRAFVPTVFPRLCKKPFADFHAEFWDWVWAIERDKQPQPCVFLVFRGGGKSATGEMALGALAARGVVKFALYVCGTQDAANSHVREVAALLESPELQALYPDLGRPMIGPYGNQKAWRMDMLQCANGFTLRGVGLDSMMIRGIRVEGGRPDSIWFDDIDALGDTPEAVLRKIATMTGTILPARNLEFCVIAFLQNLIHRDSVATQISRKATPFLRHAKIIGPVPGVRDLTFDEVEPGIGVITGGTATWPDGADLAVQQILMDDLTLDGYLVEVQHDIDRIALGAIYPMWSEIHHIITESEFMSYYGDESRNPTTGEFILPKFFRTGVGHDWGATITHPATATVWARPSEGTSPHFDYLANTVFKIGEIVAPFTREEEKLMTPHYFGDKMLEFLLTKASGENGYGVAYIDRCDIMTMSHEALSERNTYLRELKRPLPFGSRPNIGKSGGIAQMSTYLEVDQDRPHPFVRYPKGHPDEGRKVAGCPRAMWIVPDDQGTLHWNAVEKVLYRDRASDNRGMKRGREEMLKYHWNRTAEGVEQQRPYALFNDVMDADRYISFSFFPDYRSLGGLAKAQKNINELFSHLRPEAIAAAVPREAALLLQTREHILQQEMRAATINAKVGGTVEGNFRLRRRIGR